MIRSTLAAAHILLLTLAFAAPAQGAPKPKEVAAAKARLSRIADDTFAAFWQEHEAQAQAAGATPNIVRQMYRWYAPARTLGLCTRYLTPTDKADWNAKLDRMIAILDAGGERIKADVRTRGEQLFQGGASDAAFQKRSAGAQQRFCERELAGAREYIAELR